MARMKNTFLFVLILLFYFYLVLISCGGGGGGESPTTSTPPATVPETVGPYSAGGTTWVSLPIRAKAEYESNELHKNEAGYISAGGEGEQHFHGIARSRENPDTIYLCQDVLGVWKSTNNGKSWNHTRDRGLYVNYMLGIEVDPRDPDHVFTIAHEPYNNAWWNPDRSPDELQGLYRSTHGGDEWELVLPAPVNSPFISFNDVNNPWLNYRRYHVNIAYDYASLAVDPDDGRTRAKVWYAAFAQNGLYRSDNFGKKNSWVKVYALCNKSAPAVSNNYDRCPYDAAGNVDRKTGLSCRQCADADKHTMVLGLYAHPSDGKTVYLLTDRGFFKSADKGVTFSAVTITGVPQPEIPSLSNPNLIVATSLQFSPLDANILYVTVRNFNASYLTTLNGVTLNRSYDGLYKSIDGGATFTRLHVPRDPRNAYNEYSVTCASNANHFHPASVSVGASGGKDVVVLLSSGIHSVDIMVSAEGGAEGTWCRNLVKRPSPGDVTPSMTDPNFSSIGKEWKSAISGDLAGVTIHPQNPIEAVAYGQAFIWKTANLLGQAADGKSPLDVYTPATWPQWNDSSTNFTGFAWSWYGNGCVFDPNNPARFGFFNMDVGVFITNNNGRYFESRNGGLYVNGNTQIGQYRAAGKVLWTGFNSGSFDPTAGSKNIVASVGLYNRTILIRSNDEGRNWTLLEEVDPNDPDRNTLAKISERNEFIQYHPQNPLIVYAGSKISRDGGYTFAKIDLSVGHYSDGKPFVGAIQGMCRKHPDTIYAMEGYLYHILRSDDAGLTWRVYTKDAGVWQKKTYDAKVVFAADPNNPDKIYTLDKDGDLAVYDGTTWKSLGVLALSGLADKGNYVRNVAIDPRDSRIIYVSMTLSGVPSVFRSTDAGATWKDISYNVPHMGGLGGPMQVNPHTGELFMGTAAGTWIFPAP